jgi:hypothetical protein
MYYTEIHVKGHINSKWSDWFGEMQVREDASGETILSGKLLDMAAVYGVISRLGSLVIPLVSVKCTEEPDKDNAVEEVNTLST